MSHAKLNHSDKARCEFLRVESLGALFTHPPRSGNLELTQRLNVSNATFITLIIYCSIHTNSNSHIMLLES